MAKLKERKLPSLVAAMREEAAAAPLVNKSMGSFSPYSLDADVDRKKSSAPLLWRLISAMVLLFAVGAAGHCAHAAIPRIGL